MSQETTASTTLSHFRIVSKMGAGGMDEVWLADDKTEPGRVGAINIKDRVRRFDMSR